MITEQEIKNFFYLRRKLEKLNDKINKNCTRIVNIIFEYYNLPKPDQIFIDPLEETICDDVISYDFKFSKKADDNKYWDIITNIIENKRYPYIDNFPKKFLFMNKRDIIKELKKHDSSQTSKQ